MRVKLINLDLIRRMGGVNIEISEAKAKKLEAEGKGIIIEERTIIDEENEEITDEENKEEEIIEGENIFPEEVIPVEA